MLSDLCIHLMFIFLKAPMQIQYDCTVTELIGFAAISSTDMIIKVDAAPVQY